MGLILYIAAGGALGAVCRWGMNTGISSVLKQPYPFGTLGVNVLGSFLMGLCIAYFLKNNELSNEMKMFLTVGFLGSFTTFSTFSMDAVTLFHNNDPYGALSYIFASVILSVGAVMLGTFLIWKVSL